MYGDQPSIQRNALHPFNVAITGRRSINAPNPEYAIYPIDLVEMPLITENSAAMTSTPSKTIIANFLRKQTPTPHVTKNELKITIATHLL